MVDNCISAEIITESAQATLEDCNSSFQFADSVCASMGELNQTVDVIVENTEQMMAISQETTNKMQSYIELMEKTTGDKVRMVATSSENTVEHSEQVLQMIKQMQELLENTLNQANQIVQESETQTGNDLTRR